MNIACSLHLNKLYFGKEKLMAILKGKKVVVIGDRDGIPGPAIAECAESAGAEVVFSSTECFV
jgi:betaine reductase